MTTPTQNVTGGDFDDEDRSRDAQAAKQARESAASPIGAREASSPPMTEQRVRNSARRRRPSVARALHRRDPKADAVGIDGRSGRCAARPPDRTASGRTRHGRAAEHYGHRSEASIQTPADGRFEPAQRPVSDMAIKPTPPPAFERPSMSTETPRVEESAKAPEQRPAVAAREPAPTPVAPAPSSHETERMPSAPRRDFVAPSSTASAPSTPMTPSAAPTSAHEATHASPPTPAPATTVSPTTPTAPVPAQRETMPPSSAPIQHTEPPRERNHTLDLPLSSPSTPAANPGPTPPTVATSPIAPARKDELGR